MWGRRKLLPQFCTSCIFIKNFSSNSHIPNFKRCKYLASKFFSLNETLSSIKVVLIWGLSPKHRLHSLVPRPSYHPVFDRLQCAKTRLEGSPSKEQARGRVVSPPSAGVLNICKMKSVPLLVQNEECVQHVPFRLETPPLLCLPK